MTEDTSETALQDRGKRLREYLLKLTCRLFVSDVDGKIKSFASGLLVQRPSGVFLITAGDFISDLNWYLETDVPSETEQQTLLLRLGIIFRVVPMLLDASTDPDRVIYFAYARLDLEKITADEQNERLQDCGYRLEAYKGEFEYNSVSDRETYAYASLNRDIEARTIGYLIRACSEEYNMAYRGTTASDEVLIFGLSGKHEGCEYYRGAMGSPIADIHGRVHALLVGSDESSNSLFGLPIADFIPLLDEPWVEPDPGER